MSQVMEHGMLPPAKTGTPSNGNTGGEPVHPPLGPRTGGPAGSLAGLTDPVLLSLIGPWPGMDPTGPLIRQCQLCHSVGREDPHGPEMKSLYLELDSWLFWWRLVRRRIFFDAAYFKLERELRSVSYLGSEWTI